MSLFILTLEYLGPLHFYWSDLFACVKLMDSFVESPWTVVDRELLKFDFG